MFSFENLVIGFVYYLRGNGLKITNSYTFSYKFGPNFMKNSSRFKIYNGWTWVHYFMDIGQNFFIKVGKFSLQTLDPLD